MNVTPNETLVIIEQSLHWNNPYRDLNAPFDVVDAINDPFNHFMAGIEAKIAIERLFNCYDCPDFEPLFNQGTKQ